MATPSDLKYSKEHEWIQVDGNKVKIGMTHYAQAELGDIVFVELPEIGDEVKANESFGSVESVKTVSELYAPISGKVIEVNEDLTDNPDTVNASPYEKGWMIVIEPSDPAEIELLLTNTEYDELINEG